MMFGDTLTVVWKGLLRYQGRRLENRHGHSRIQSHCVGQRS